MMSTRGVARAAAVAALVLLAAGAAQADVFNMGGTRDPVMGAWTGLASLEKVAVGNVGNASDSTGYGSVAYSYNIGKYDVTAAQYTAFLNAVAKTDTYSLYNPYMWSDTSYGCQIQQTGTSGSYTYSVSSAYANRPVNYVNFWSACRFSNWLNNGQQGAGTTEYGAYTMTSSGIVNNTITRNTGATWAVTSEDEWYKAAYYNAVTGTYNLYAIGGNSITTDMANYFYSVGHTTDVGSYPNTSPYGTYDQTGNVWEWNEAIIGGTTRGMRGGAYNSYYSFLQASYRYANYTTLDNINIGFRVSEVPEPATMSLLALAGLGMLLRRRIARNM